ncbi:MAG: amidohydrolase/deacetylase family metallohydrolase [Nitrospinota bacterium]|nr:MAG: amidohydrolase/deacetylase family metallohydrolase [Nitrospinota bacterium]
MQAKEGMMYELLLKGGRVLDPTQGLDEELDVALAGGKVARLAPRIPAEEAKEVLEVPGKLVTPGLIDMHVHVFAGVSHYGVDVDPGCLAKGVTTALDAGSAGSQTFPGFRRYIIDVCATRLFALLNISAIGMVTGMESTPAVGELEEIRYLHTGAAIQTIEENRDVILGVKVRLSSYLARDGQNERQALKLAREAADAVQLPLMIHTPDSSLPLEDILAMMKEGDILTHCFHGRRAGILDERGKVRGAVRKAIERGVLLDVGHGVGSFTFQTATTAMAQGIMPSTISSDLHRYNINGPVFDLATTVSKFLLLGVPLDEALKRVTTHPARALKMEGQIGTLKEGAEGDVAVFELAEGEFSFVDTAGEERIGHQKLIPVHVIRGGKIYRKGN